MRRSRERRDRGGIVAFERLQHVNMLPDQTLPTLDENDFTWPCFGGVSTWSGQSDQVDSGFSRDFHEASCLLVFSFLLSVGLNH